jgi:hypothetical protein
MRCRPLVERITEEKYRTIEVRRLGSLFALRQDQIREVILLEGFLIDLDALNEHTYT